jgi:hypothetical protein
MIHDDDLLPLREVIGATASPPSARSARISCSISISPAGSPAPPVRLTA